MKLLIMIVKRVLALIDFLIEYKTKLQQVMIDSSKSWTTGFDCGNNLQDFNCKIMFYHIFIKSLF